ncbi:response regulator [Desulfuromonas sp. AOP6]|uniref:response regulator n=1 Tax=Desulfuromonas sp. AOP6 TaxID=1566351 RepID=UPI00127A8C43|nr:response regulator [Desulfuromonas sp. AOP6]BCA80783.1 response regulator [Desulfuromonas sp. AOP6]
MMERAILIADKDPAVRKQMAALCIESGYQVVATNSAARVLRDILKRNVQVVLLGSEFDELAAADLIPLFKMLNRDLPIILMSNEVSLAMERRIRRDGIFYHALKPLDSRDREEIRLALKCAFEELENRLAGGHARKLSVNPQ